MHFRNIQHIFFDLDNTLWDFSKNSKRIISEMYELFQLKEKGIHDLDAFYKQYASRNENLWSAYSMGDISREEVRLHRFLYTLDDFGVKDYVTALGMADHYIHHTKHQTELLPHAMETLQYLRVKYQLHIITNGFNEVQYFKLRNSNIDHFFETVTTAEEAQCLKPGIKIFDIALKKVPARAEESLYIGDTAHIDGVGSLNAGLQFILFNPEKKENAGNYHQVHSLQELKGIL
ncbi:MAG: YjjG family noncanonical pyrimidine nucleotidase [Chitinophagales bacterium]